MNANLYIIEDYENEPPSGPKKNKPKQTQFKPCPERSRMGQSRNNSKPKGALGGLGNLLIGKIGNIITFFLTFPLKWV